MYIVIWATILFISDYSFSTEVDSTYSSNSSDSQVMRCASRFWSRDPEKNPKTCLPKVNILNSYTCSADSKMLQMIQQSSENSPERNVFHSVIPTNFGTDEAGNRVVTEVRYINYYLNDDVPAKIIRMEAYDQSIPGSSLGRRVMHLCHPFLYDSKHFNPGPGEEDSSLGCTNNSRKSDDEYQNLNDQYEEFKTKLNFHLGWSGAANCDFAKDHQKSISYSEDPDQQDIDNFLDCREQASTCGDESLEVMNTDQIEELNSTLSEENGNFNRELIHQLRMGLLTTQVGIYSVTPQDAGLPPLGPNSKSNLLSDPYHNCNIPGFKRNKEFKEEVKKEQNRFDNGGDFGESEISKEDLETVRVEQEKKHTIQMLFDTLEVKIRECRHLYLQYAATGIPEGDKYFEILGRNHILNLAGQETRDQFFQDSKSVLMAAGISKDINFDDFWDRQKCSSGRSYQNYLDLKSRIEREITSNENALNQNGSLHGLITAARSLKKAAFINTRSHIDKVSLQCGDADEFYKNGIFSNEGLTLFSNPNLVGNVVRQLLKDEAPKEKINYFKKIYCNSMEEKQRGDNTRSAVMIGTGVMAMAIPFAPVVFPSVVLGGGLAAASTTVGLIATGIDITASYNDYQISSQNLSNTQANFAAGNADLRELQEAESTMNWSTFGMAAAGLGGIIEAGGLTLNVLSRLNRTTDLLNPKMRRILNQAGASDRAIDNVDAAIRSGKLDEDALNILNLQCKKSAADCANEINALSELHRIDESPNMTTTRTETCALNVYDGCRYYFEGLEVSPENPFATTPSNTQEIPSAYGNGTMTTYNYSTPDGQTPDDWTFLTVIQSDQVYIRHSIANPNQFFSSPILGDYPNAINNFINIKKIKPGTYQLGDFNAMNGSIDALNAVAPDNLKTINRYYDASELTPTATESSNFLFIQKIGENFSWPMGKGDIYHLHDVGNHGSLGLMDKRYATALSGHAAGSAKYLKTIKSMLKSPELEKNMVSQLLETELSNIRRAKENGFKYIGDTDPDLIKAKLEKRVKEDIQNVYNAIEANITDKFEEAGVHLDDLLKTGQTNNYAPPLAKTSTNEMLRHAIDGTLKNVLNVGWDDKTNVLKNKFVDVLEILTMSGKVGNRPPLPNYKNSDLINTAIQKLEIANTL